MGGQVGGQEGREREQQAVGTCAVPREPLEGTNHPCPGFLGSLALMFYPPAHPTSRHTLSGSNLHHGLCPAFILLTRDPTCSLPTGQHC